MSTLTLKVKTAKDANFDLTLSKENTIAEAKRYLKDVLNLSKPFHLAVKVAGELAVLDKEIEKTTFKDFDDNAEVETHIYYPDVKKTAAELVESENQEKAKPDADQNQ